MSLRDRTGRGDVMELVERGQGQEEGQEQSEEQGQEGGGGDEEQG